MSLHFSSNTCSAKPSIGNGRKTNEKQCNPTSDISNEGRLRFLCLHGCEQDRIVMENKCDTLLGPKGLGRRVARDTPGSTTTTTPTAGRGHQTGSARHAPRSAVVPAAVPDMSTSLQLVIETIYIDAPFLLPKRSRSDEIQMRTWRDAKACPASTTRGGKGPPREGDGSDSPSSSFLPSFIPKDYVTSVAAVLGQLLEDSCDVLFGFSEGCIVASYVALALEWFTRSQGERAEGGIPKSEKEVNAEADGGSVFALIPPLRALILAAPPPLPSALPAGLSLSLPILAYIGQKDAIVSPAASRKLVQQLSSSPSSSSSALVTIFEHSGAHMVPYSADAIATTRKFIAGSLFTLLTTAAGVSEGRSHQQGAILPSSSESELSTALLVNPTTSLAAAASSSAALSSFSPPASAPARMSGTRYILPRSREELNTILSGEAWLAVSDEVDVLRSMFGDGAEAAGELAFEESAEEELSKDEGELTPLLVSPAYWRSLKSASEAVDQSLKLLTSVVAIVGGAQCLIEKVRSDLDNSFKSPLGLRGMAGGCEGGGQALAVVAQLLIPLLSRQQLTSGCGSNLAPVAKKQLAEMGEGVVACVTVFSGYPEEIVWDGGGESGDSVGKRPSVVLSLVSGVVRPAMHIKTLKALLREELPALAAASASCPHLLQLAMAAAEGLQTPLTEYYVSGCAISASGEAEGGHASDGDEGDDEESNALDLNNKKVLAAAWAAVDEETADEREAKIEAARKFATETLLTSSYGVSGGWRRKYCGHQSTAGGTWDLVFGLVGKPSAGKSSFFSAASKTPAKVGSYPFTTIEPNISPAFAPMACPCSEYYRYLLTANSSSAFSGIGSGEDGSQPNQQRADLYKELLASSPCGAEHSCVYDPSLSITRRIRRQPVLLKDVAGLVKGAYQGCGKGNRFLNDLCEADVLIHVVDGAGATNADGWECAVGEGNPLSDVEWVRNEVHSWIFDNIRAKWQAIRRRPNKFKEMFSGYRASSLLVDMVLSLAGVRSAADLAEVVPRWLPDDLHRFVSLFVFVRFPMVLAVNKMDLATEAVVACGERIAKANPMDIVACLSAKEELAMSVKATAATESAAPKVTSAYAAFIESANKSVRAGSSVSVSSQSGSEGTLLTFGLQNVLRAAVEACLPISVYSVSDITPLLGGPSYSSTACEASNNANNTVSKEPFDRERAVATHVAKEILPHVLSSCALIRPGTSVESAKASFLNIPNNRKLVRIEAVHVPHCTCRGLEEENLSHHSSSSAGGSSAAPSQGRSAGYPRKPVLMHPQDEFTTTCFLHVMTNAKA